MKVAILITTYNRLNLLKRTLKSLHKSLKNDKNDLTIFVVDDGSTDGTEKYLSGKKINNLYITKNGGLRNALNHGLNFCFNVTKPEYISYVQDDVEFKEGWLQECIDRWEYFKHEKIGFITGHNAPEHPIKTQFTNGDILRWTCRATHMFASTKRWKEFGEIPDLTPGVAAPKPGQGSLVDWWLVGHPEGKYPESKNSLKKKGEYVLCLPGRIKHMGERESTWGIINPEY